MQHGHNAAMQRCNMEQCNDAARSDATWTQRSDATMQHGTMQRCRNGTVQQPPRPWRARSGDTSHTWARAVPAYGPFPIRRLPRWDHWVLGNHAIRARAGAQLRRIRRRRWPVLTVGCCRRADRLRVSMRARPCVRVRVRARPCVCVRLCLSTCVRASLRGRARVRVLVCARASVCVCTCARA